MRFHLVDRIIAYAPARSIRARKVTSRHETYWRYGTGGPSMPPALALETLCQAGACLVMLSTDLRSRAALLSVADVEFGVPARPGEVLEIEATVEAMSDETAVMSGTVTAGERLVVRAADVMCVLVPPDDLEDPADTRRQLDMLTRDVLAAAGAGS